MRESLIQPGDIYCYKLWSYTAVKFGIEGVYNFPYRTTEWCGYPLVIPVILWAIGLLYKIVFSPSFDVLTFDTCLRSVTFTILIKLPMFFTDMITSLLIFIVIRRPLGFKTALLAMVSYAFNPAVIYNTAIWGPPYDSLMTLLMFLGIVTLDSGRIWLSWLFICLATLTKPQGVFLFPIILLVGWKKYGLKACFFVVIVAVLTTVTIRLPFLYKYSLNWLPNLYFDAMNLFPYTSTSAFNLWAFFGFWVPDTHHGQFLSYHLLGILFFSIFLTTTEDGIKDLFNLSSNTNCRCYTPCESYFALLLYFPNVLLTSII